MSSIRINPEDKVMKLVFSALMIAIGTVLSLFSFQGFWVYGGGVTFCSMLPLVIVSYVYGTPWGLFTAFVYSLVQMVLGFNNVMYGSTVLLMILIAVLDYILAFTAVGLAAIFKGRFKNETIGLVLGVVLALFLRFVCHFISGWFIWEAMWPNEYGMISPIYSAAYNGSFMLPEIIITAIVAVILDQILHFTSWGSKKAEV